MTSLLTNNAALTVLQNISHVQKDLEMTQGRISSGMRVGTAADNAAYWSIATTMRSDNSSLSAVKDALGIGASTLDVASTALNSSVDIVSQIKAKLVAAREPGVDRTKIQADISQLQKSLADIAETAGINGENWLSQDSSTTGYNATKAVVASFARSATGVSVSTIDLDTSKIKMFDANDQSGIVDKSRTVGSTTTSLGAIDVSSLTNSAADQQTLNDYITMADNAQSDVTAAASTLGSASHRITIQQSFVSTLMDSITSGIGQLVDADMTKESTRLQALQAQQQLGIQSLSIANSANQQLLKLFGG